MAVPFRGQLDDSSSYRRCPGPCVRHPNRRSQYRKRRGSGPEASGTALDCTQGPARRSPVWSCQRASRVGRGSAGSGNHHHRPRLVSRSFFQATAPPTSRTILINGASTLNKYFTRWKRDRGLTRSGAGPLRPVGRPTCRRSEFSRSNVVRAHLRGAGAFGDAHGHSTMVISRLGCIQQRIERRRPSASPPSAWRDAETPKTRKELALSSGKWRRGWDSNPR